jgi:hypothetical protein
MGLTYYPTLNMEAMGSSETLITIYQTTCHIAGDSDLHSKDYENLKFQV